MRHYYIIETRYHGPTNHRGARVSAKRLDGYGRKVTIPYDYDATDTLAHRCAAETLLTDFEGHAIVGSAETADGYGWIVDPRPAV